MVGIVFATREEAEPFLKAYRRGRFDSLTEGEVLHDDDILVTITGIGKIKATLRTERMLQRHSVDRLLHVGACTALSEKLETESLVGANQVFEGDRIELSTPSYPRMPLSVPFEGLTEGVLVTQEHLVKGDEEQSYWQRIADVSDMTGYAVTYVAATRGTSCHIVKVVTGQLSSEDNDFQKIRARAHQTLSEFLLETIPDLEATS